MGAGKPDPVTVVTEALLAQMEHLLTDQRAHDVAVAVVYDLVAAGHLPPPVLAGPAGPQ